MNKNLLTMLAFMLVFSWGAVAQSYNKKFGVEINGGIREYHGDLGSALYFKVAPNYQAIGGAIGMYINPSFDLNLYGSAGDLGFYKQTYDVIKAEICYNKVLELDPNYIDAYINLAYVKLESKKALVDEMAALGNTPKEMELYDKLKAKKDDLVRSAIPYLKKALVIEPKNQDVMKSLLGVYRSLDMTNEYNSLKASM